MSLYPESPLTAIVSLPANISYLEPAPTPVQHTLQAIDQALSVLAIAAVLIIAIWWSARPNLATLRNVPWRPNRVYEDAIALAVAVYLGAAAVFSGVASLLAGESESLLGTMFVGSGAQVIGIAACLVIAAKRFDGGMARFCFGQRTAPRRSTALLIAVVILLALGVCPLIRDATVSVVTYVAPDHEFKPHATIRALYEPGQPLGVFVALWAGAAVVAPLAEECFFRGLLQTFLVNVIPHRWGAIFMTSLAFGAVHFPQPHAIGALVFLAVLLGYAYERTGSVLIVVVIHAVFNLKTLVWVTLGGPVT